MESKLYKECMIRLLIGIGGLLVGFVILLSGNLKFGVVVLVLGVLYSVAIVYLNQRKLMEQVDLEFPLEKAPALMQRIQEVCLAEKFQNVGTAQNLRFKKKTVLGGDRSTVSVSVEKESDTKCVISVWGDLYISKSWQDMAKCKDIILNTINQYK